MKQHVIEVGLTAYYELQRISSILLLLVYCLDQTTAILSSWALLTVLCSRCRKSRFRFTSYSQRNAPPSLHILHTTTSLDPDFRTDQMQIWTHLLQSLYRWICLLLSLRTAAALQPFPFFPIFIRHTYAQPPMLQPQIFWFSLIFLLWSSHLKKKNLPQDVMHCTLFLQAGMRLPKVS